MLPNSNNTVTVLSMNTPHPDNLPRTQLHNDLIAEVLSWLPVKSLTRLKSVCKSWNTLIISDHTFIKLHLHRSALRGKPHLLLQRENTHHDHREFCVTHLSGSGLSLVENPWINLAHNPRYPLKKGDRYRVAGSCNGLICLHGYSVDSMFQQGWLSFWNPATRLMSEKLGCFCVKTKNFDVKLSFGYDNSTDTYKVVFFEIEKKRRASLVSVFTLDGCNGWNGWRDIQNFPLLPFSYDGWGVNDGVHLRGTINWMTSRDESAPYYNPVTITVEQLGILSLDLRTETYTLLSPPKGLDEVSRVVPSVGVLMNCLCFSHDLEGTHFVIWQMTKFGDAKSWTQLLKVRYQDLQREPLHNMFYCHYQLFDLFPLCFHDGDTLILASYRDRYDDNEAILYDKRANTADRTALETESNYILWFSSFDYVESLVSPLRVRSSTKVAKLNLC